MELKLVSFFCLFTLANSIVVYKSNPIKEGDKLGLQYAKSEGQIVQPSMKSFTTCVRFFYKTLGHRLIYFGSGYNDRYFLWLSANYPHTWWGLGNYELGKEYYSNWILKHPQTNDFSIWKTNFWHHLCISFSASTSIISFVLDGLILKHDKDRNLIKIDIPTDFLDHIYVGCCTGNHQGMITDFNLWDKSLSTKEMEDWTNCR